MRHLGWPTHCTREGTTQVGRGSRKLSLSTLYCDSLSYLSLARHSFKTKRPGFLFLAPQASFGIVSNMQDHYLGIDVGGTKTEVCLLRLKDPLNFQTHEVLERKRMPTERTTSFGSYMDRLKALIGEVLTPHSVSLSQISGIGIGLPGSIDPLTQRMVAGSIPFFSGFHLPDAFKKHLNFNGPVVLDNDANCFALAEAHLGAGADFCRENGMQTTELCMLAVTLGTGVGGGIVACGELIRGRRGGAGEIGHTTLIEGGRACYCGKLGCAEQYLSGSGFQASYLARASALEHLNGKEIFKRIEEGHPLALATLEYYRDHLVTFLSNLSNVLDPHLIVLGGGMSTQSRIYTGLSERLSKACFLTTNPPVVTRYTLGESSGVLGAALLTFSRLHRAHAPEGIA